MNFCISVSFNITEGGKIIPDPAKDEGNKYDTAGLDVNSFCCFTAFVGEDGMQEAF
jgi:hypothetical protein